MRDITGSPTNAVLYELMVAARTDGKLNAHLRDVMAQYTAKILDAARTLPGFEVVGAETFPVLVALLTNVFDGAAMVARDLPGARYRGATNRVAIQADNGTGRQRGRLATVLQ